MKFDVIEKTNNCISIATQHKTEDWCYEAEYEVYSRGYIICTFSIKALKNHARLDELKIGISFNKDVVFSNWFNIKNNYNDNSFRYGRAISVEFSTDERKVTNSIDFILESIGIGTGGSICRKVYEECENSRFLGWRIENPTSFKRGYKYQNR
jgi:hypothetical protein